MRYFVYDCYATSNQGRILHFNVVCAKEDQSLALVYSHAWLKEIKIETPNLKPENCHLCHRLDEIPQQMALDISAKGFAIYPLEGCPTGD